MAFTVIQKLRKMRATNKGTNRRLATSLRSTAAWLSQKGPEEFSQREIKDLQSLRKLINLRLYLNAVTKAHDEFIANPEQFQTPDGGYSIELGKKDQ